MPTTLDCYIMRNIFGSNRMRANFDSSRLLQGWLDVWAALAEAEAEVGLIPEEAARQIRAVAKVDYYDLQAIGAGIESGRHSLLPSIRALAEKAGDAGKYVHWGTTTQDIIDTGCVLQIRDALDVIETELRTQIGFLIPLAEKYRSQAMAGRTHWQHAVPITFGMKIALWIDEMSRHVERLRRCRELVLVCQMGGAGGTLASLGEYAERVQQAFSRRIGLPLPSAPWYNVRDRLGELVSVLGLIAATGERICGETGRLSSTEIGELSESQTKTQVGSSTMPQKKNPINGERAVANFHLVRGLVPVMQEICVVPHERDMSTTATEWLLLPQIFILLDGGLTLAHRILSDLQVHTDRMSQNLRITGGGIVAEAVMFGLAKHLGRNRAHEITVELAKRAYAEKRPLFEVMAENAEVRRYLEEDELRRLVEPENHIGMAEAVVDRVIDNARSLAIMESR